MGAPNWSVCWQETGGALWVAEEACSGRVTCKVSLWSRKQGCRCWCGNSGVSPALSSRDKRTGTQWCPSQSPFMGRTSHRSKRPSALTAPRGGCQAAASLPSAIQPRPPCSWPPPPWRGQQHAWGHGAIDGLSPESPRAEEVAGLCGGESPGALLAARAPEVTAARAREVPAGCLSPGGPRWLPKPGRSPLAAQAREVPAGCPSTPWQPPPGQRRAQDGPVGGAVTPDFAWPPAVTPGLVRDPWDFCCPPGRGPHPHGAVTAALAPSAPPAVLPPLGSGSLAFP